MATLSDKMGAPAQTVRIAIIRPQHEVLFAGDVSAVQAGGGLAVGNISALKEAYPDGEVIYPDAGMDIATGYIWSGGVFVPPATVPRFAPYQIFAMFTEAERSRYFAAIDAADVSVRTVSEMIRLQAGTLLEGTHPVVQSALVILRLAGVIDSDARLTELGNSLQGV